MEHRVRPYGRRPDDVTVDVAVAVILLRWCGALLGESLSAGAVAGMVAFDVVFVIVVWRIVSLGLFVNDSGIKVQTVWRTRVFAWTQIIPYTPARPAATTHVRSS